MKTSKHTSGPWLFVGSAVFTKKGAYYIAETAIKGNSFTRQGAEAEANARLIAAAPELLEALKFLCDCFKGQHSKLGAVQLAGLMKAYTAIERAEGSNR